MAFRHTTDNEIIVYALGRAIENELSTIIENQLVPHFHSLSELITDKKELEALIAAYSREIAIDEDVKVCTIDDLERAVSGAIDLLIPYTSFKYKFKLILSHKKYADDDITRYLKTIIDTDVNQLNEIRSNAVHSRPVTRDDKVMIIEILSKFPKNSFPTIHAELKAVTNNPQNYVIDDEVDYWDKGFSHNVPHPPSYENTGFLGRESDIKQIKEILNKRARVITIHGKAGVGKTAITQRIAYDLIEENRTFDLILWYSFKREKLTTRGIEEIKGLTSLSQIKIKDEMIIDSDDDENHEAYSNDEFFKYLDDHESLIILDNLESIQDGINFGATKQFIEELQDYSKVLITTRSQYGINLGRTHTIGDFKLKDSKNLIRRLSSDLNIDILLKADDDQLNSWADKLYNNPLWIKTFINLVHQGQDPRIILNDIQKGKNDIGQYAYQKNYDNLDKTSIDVLSITYNTATSNTFSRLLVGRIYNEWKGKTISARKLKEITHKLADQNFLDWGLYTKGELELSQFARNWIQGSDNRITKEFSGISKAKIKVQDEVNTAQRYRGESILNHSNFITKNEDERIIAIKLRECSNAIKKHSKEKIRLSNFFHDLPELGSIYDGSCTGVKDYGAFFMYGDKNQYTSLAFKDHLQDFQTKKVRIGDQLKVKVFQLSEKGASLTDDLEKEIIYPEFKNSDEVNNYLDQIIQEAINSVQNEKNNAVEEYFEIERLLGLLKTYQDGKAPEVGEHYRRALEIDPKQAKTYFNYGIFLRDQHESEYVEQIKRAYEIAPDETKIVCEYAKTLPIEEGIILHKEEYKRVKITQDRILITQSLFRMIHHYFRYDSEYSDMSLLESIAFIEDAIKGYIDKLTNQNFDETSFNHYLMTLMTYLNLKIKQKYIENREISINLFHTSIDNIDIKTKQLGKYLLTFADILFFHSFEDYEKLIDSAIFRDSVNDHIISSRKIGVINKDQNKRFIIISGNNRYHYAGRQKISLYLFKSLIKEGWTIRFSTSPTNPKKAISIGDINYLNLKPR